MLSLLKSALAQKYSFWNALALQAISAISLTCIAPDAWASSPRKWMTPDFYIETHSEPWISTRSASSSSEQTCRDEIKKLMCMVESEPTGGEYGSDRPCLPGGEAYAPFFETLYDHYPPALQRVFCSLKVIYVEKDFAGTAYAGLMTDSSGKTVGAKMGIRKSVLDDQLTLSAWASWKEQLSFGGVTDSYTHTPGLPLIFTQTDAPVNDFLYFVIAHEFGHIFDFANGINRYASDECRRKQEKDSSIACELHPESWGALSWITDQTAKPENEFPNRKNLCFYWCEDHPLNRSIASSLYESLDRSAFISIYATTQPWDDFADSLAYFLMAENLKTRYLLDTAQGRTYDVMAKLRSPQFASKHQFLKSFMNRNDLRYP